MKVSPLTVSVYAYHNELMSLGEIQLLYDRVISINLKVPLSNKCKALKKGKLFKGFLQKKEEISKIIQSNDSLPYELQPISKGEIMYRNYKMTHILKCEGLNEHCSGQLLIRLTTFEKYKIDFYNKKLIWQSNEFIKKLIEEVSKIVLIALISILISLLNTRDEKPTEKSKMKKNLNNEKIKATNHSEINDQLLRNDLFIHTTSR